VGDFLGLSIISKKPAKVTPERSEGLAVKTGETLLVLRFVSHGRKKCDGDSCVPQKTIKHYRPATRWNNRIFCGVRHGYANSLSVALMRSKTIIANAKQLPIIIAASKAEA